MKKSLFTVLTVAAFALATSAGSAHAQGTAQGTGHRHSPTDEQRAARKAKLEALTPAQRDAMKARMKEYREQRKSLMEQVKAGKIDRKTADEQLKAWREAHKPSKP